MTIIKWEKTICRNICSRNANETAKYPLSIENIASESTKTTMKINSVARSLIKHTTKGIYGYDWTGMINWRYLDPKDVIRASRTSEMKIRPVKFSLSFRNELFDPMTWLRHLIDQKSKWHTVKKVADKTRTKGANNRLKRKWSSRNLYKKIR